MASSKLGPRFFRDARRAASPTGVLPGPRKLSSLASGSPIRYTTPRSVLSDLEGFHRHPFGAHAPGADAGGLATRGPLLRYPVAIALLAAPLLSLAVSGCGGMPRQGIARGADLYDTCRPCHGDKAAGNPELGAPPIAGLPRWYIEAQLGKFRSGQRGTSPADVEGHRMRPMARSLNIEGDVGSVAQYVASLPVRTAPTTLQGGNATAGAASYGGVCTVCHGADGMGNEAMGAPPLVHESDWYILRALDKFKSHVRGYDSTDAQGQQMATMSSTLQDHQAMLDVIAYIRTLRK